MSEPVAAAGVERGGDYISPAKDNQKALHENIERVDGPVPVARRRKSARARRTAQHRSGCRSRGYQGCVAGRVPKLSVYGSRQVKKGTWQETKETVYLIATGRLHRTPRHPASQSRSIRAPKSCIVGDVADQLKDSTCRTPGAAIPVRFGGPFCAIPRSRAGANPRPLAVRTFAPPACSAAGSPGFWPAFFARWGCGRMFRYP